MHKLTDQTTQQLCLLGTPVQIIQGKEQPLHSRYRKTLALLAYLVAEPNRPHSRDFLSSLLWPELSEAAARVNLRQVLSDLSRLLNQEGRAHPLVADRQSLTFRFQTGLEVDIHQLDYWQSFAQTQQTEKCEQLLGFLPQLNSRVLTAEFLAAYSLPGCEEFELWLFSKREQLRVRQITLLQALINCCQRQGMVDQALNLLHMLMSLDSDNETHLRLAMRLYAESGRISSALKLFDSFSQRLDRELGVLPETITLALRDSLLSHHQLQPSETLTPSARFPAIEKISFAVVLRVHWLSQHDDPEESAQALFDADQLAHELFCQALNAHRVAGAGRGAFFYFGWPKSQPDAAWCAVRAAIRLTDRIRRQEALEVKIGLHSGRLLSSLEKQLPDLLGDVTDEASHICHSAQAGQILMSEAFAQLLGRRMRYHKINERRRQSDGNTQAVYALLEEPGWLDSEMPHPLLGREEILIQLDSAWQQVQTDLIGQVVEIYAAAGLGKTALICHWLQGLRQKGSSFYKLSGYPDLHTQLFAPLCIGIKQLLGMNIDHPYSPDVVRERLHRRGWTSMAQSSLLVELLSQPDRYRESDPGAFAQAFKHWLVQLTPVKPQICWLEDAHWCDSETLTLLLDCIRELKLPLLLLLSSRHPLLESSLSEQLIWVKLELACLSDSQSRQFIHHQLERENRWLTPAQIRQILQFAQGNPFLLQQLTQAESLSPLPQAALALISDDLEQLTPYQEVVELAALIGSEFEWGLLAPLLPQFTDAVLRQNLNELTHQRFLVQINSTTYAFHSELLRFALCDLLPRSRKRHLYRMLALTSEQLNREKGIISDQRLAYYWQEAGGLETALKTWKSAAEQAMSEQRYSEAADYLQKALHIERQLNPEPNQIYYLLNDLATARMLAISFNDPLAFKCAQEAEYRLRQNTESPEYFRALCLGFLSTLSDQPGKDPLSLAQRMLDHAHSASDHLILNWAMASALMSEQKIEAARIFIEQAQSWLTQMDSNAHKSWRHPLYLIRLSALTADLNQLFFHLQKEEKQKNRDD